MTEPEVRALLAGFDSFDRLEAWIAGQTWQAEPDGWTVLTDRGGWRFRVRPVAGGVRVSATAPGGGAPATWVVPGA